MTLDEQEHAFMAYVAGLISDFGRYMGSGSADPVRDGAAFHVGAMWLTDEEFMDLARDLTTVISERLANAPATGRRRRMIYTVSLPAPEDATS